MADSPASLQRKIGSASELQAVVRAMKAQAAASVGQYERSVSALADYALTVERGLGVCFRVGETPTEPPEGKSPAAGAGPAPPARAVVFGSDQGLVGRFNDIVVDFAQAQMSQAHAGQGKTRVWVVGDRVRQGLSDRGMGLLGSFEVPASVQGIPQLVAQILTQVGDAIDTHATAAPEGELHLYFNRLGSGSAYEPVGLRLLPLDAGWRRALAARPWPTAMRAEVLGSAIDSGAQDHEANGSPPAGVLRALVREFLFVSIFRACAESLASENASRLAAMDRADRNIDHLLVKLQGRYQRLRQSVIDEELADVISGFKAVGQMAEGRA